jgi:uncharacterized protein
MAVMRVVITGATGTIGQAVADRLKARGDEVVALSRDAGRAREALGVEAHAWDAASPPPALEGADAVVHLLGERIDQRWTDDAKRRIRASRVDSTRALVEGMRAAGTPVLISQSATGIYGPRDATPLDETAATADDFLAEVVKAWEAEARAADDFARVVTTRTGVVLSPSGGALSKMLPFFKLGVGGPVAGGSQYVSWVHLDDVAGAIVHCLDDEAARGPVNLTAPRPVTNTELSKALGRVIHRPAFLPVPGLAVKALYGEMAQVVTTGQNVVPRRLGELGYTFAQPELEPALRDVLG